MNRRYGLALIGILTSSSALATEPVQPIEPYQASNQAKVELGKKLYFDPRLSKSGFISCNSCHNLGTGGDDNMPTSIGHGWQKGPRNSPTVLNAVFNEAQFWDGRAADLAEQAKGPVQAAIDLGLWVPPAGRGTLVLQLIA